MISATVLAPTIPIEFATWCHDFGTDGTKPLKRLYPSWVSQVVPQVVTHPRRGCDTWHLAPRG